MKVIMCAYGVGYKSTLPPKNVIKLNLNTYRTEYRERTEEELQIEKEKWDSTPHLLSGEGYVNRIRHEKIAFLNPEFPNNIIKKINELQKEGLFDIILVESDSALASALKQRDDIEFVYFYQEKKKKRSHKCFQTKSCHYVQFNFITKIGIGLKIYHKTIQTLFLYKVRLQKN